MEVTSTNKDEENLAEKIPIEESSIVKEIEADIFENDCEKVAVEENSHLSNAIDYDDDSGDEYAVITKTSNANDSSPAKTMFSIKTISNSQLQNNYKLSKTAVDLDHPGNINGVPTIDYDLSKLVDEYKPWKKPGADVSDYFNYGFTEETWLLYCEKQKTLRLSQENSALKTLSGLQNFGYPLSGSHIHLGFNRSNHKNNKGGLIDVIGSQQNDYKTKHNDMGMGMGSKISTIPVQTGNVNVGPNQASNYMTGLANQAINSNLLTPIMSAAMAMGILPNAGNVQVLTNNSQPGGPLDSKMSQYGPVDGGNMRNNHSYNAGGVSSSAGNWNNPNYDRSNSVDSMHSHEDYDRKPYLKSDRGSRRSEHDDGSRRYKSRERRDRSSERRRRSRSRSRERAHDSKHARKRNRTPEESRRHRKHSRDRHSSGGDSDRRHRRHRSSKRHRQSRSRSYDNRKDRHQRRHKSPGEESAGGKYSKSGGYKDDGDSHGGHDKNGDSNNNNNNGGGGGSDNVKREMDYPGAD